MLNNLKVALVHDWLTGMRGGEKVLECLCEIFPQAHIFTLIYKKGALSPAIESKPIHVSFLQKVPAVMRDYRNYLPLFPLAVESFNLKGYDLVISSSHCVAKGAKRPNSSFHICYCHTPMRYMWVFFDQYFGDYPEWKKKLVRLAGEYLKNWDLSTLGRVNEFISISETIRERIKTIYNRESTIINPPVEVDKFNFVSSVKKEDFYLCVCALVPYKRIDIMVEAFNKMPDKKLFLVGCGDSRKELEKKRTSDNIKFLGWMDEKDLVGLYHKAKAFLYAAEEDFGIAPVEAQAAGLPVIVYGRGGTAETTIPLGSEAGGRHPTGLFFFKQDSDSLIEAIEKFEKHEKEFCAQYIRENALRFSRDIFKTKIKKFIEEKLNA